MDWWAVPTLHEPRMRRFNLPSVAFGYALLGAVVQERTLGLAQPLNPLAAKFAPASRCFSSATRFDILPSGTIFAN